MSFIDSSVMIYQRLSSCGLTELKLFFGLNQGVGKVQLAEASYPAHGLVFVHLAAKFTVKM